MSSRKGPPAPHWSDFLFVPVHQNTCPLTVGWIAIIAATFLVVGDLEMRGHGFFLDQIWATQPDHNKWNLTVPRNVLSADDDAGSALIFQNYTLSQTDGHSPSMFKISSIGSGTDLLIQ